MPPIPWQAKTSSVSSILDRPARQLATKLETTPATKPIMTAAMKLTYPEAAVIAAKPQTAPTAMPIAEGLPLITQSISIQLTAAAAAAKLVTTTADAARLSAANALPPLKPNHPNQSKPAPKITYGMFVGLNSVAKDAGLPAPFWSKALSWSFQ